MSGAGRSPVFGRQATTWPGPASGRLTPGDEEILARAIAEGRVLIALDKDFGELAVVRELPHAGIVRLVGFSATHQAEMTLRVLQLHGADLAAGAIVTAEAGRLRVRLRTDG